MDDALVPTERFIVFLPAFPAIAVDGDNVYVAYHDARLGDADVWIWASPNGGRTWEDRRRVNDTAVRDGTSQYLPKVSVAPGGRVDVLYYDRRDDADNRLNETPLQSSFDSGTSFIPRVELSTEAFDSGIGFGIERGLPDLGGRLALLSTDSHALGVWTDTRLGTPASGQQDLVRALVAFTEPPSLPATAQAVLRYGGMASVAAGLIVLIMWLMGSRGAPRRKGDASPEEPSETGAPISIDPA